MYKTYDASSTSLALQKLRHIYRKLERQVVMAKEVLPYCMSTVQTKLIRMTLKK